MLSLGILNKGLIMAQDNCTEEQWRLEFIKIVLLKTKFFDLLWVEDKKRFRTPKVQFAWEVFLEVKKSSIANE
jgi:hypothetical protein